MEEKTVCRTPNPDKKPVRIDSWKFNLVRQAILTVLPREGNGLPWRELPILVERRIPAQEKRRLGSIGWYTITVKLELEVRGEIGRIEGVSPQRLLRLK